MSSGEYERVRKAVATRDSRDDTQDQQLASLEALAANLSAQITELQLRTARLEQAMLRR